MSKSLLAINFLFVSIFSYLAILNFYHLGSREFDLGVIGNVIANTAYGDFFASSIYSGKSFLGVHLSFIYLPIAFFFRLAPYAETLLILQALAVVFATIPLFYLSKILLNSEKTAFIISLIYLLHPATQGAVFYEFHELAFFPLLYFASVYFLLTKRLLWFVISFLLLLSCKEDCALIFAFSIPLFRNKISTRNALYIFTGSIVWYLASFYIRNEIGTQDHNFTWYYKDLLTLGSNPAEIILSRFTASRMIYIFLIFTPLLFIPFSKFNSFLSVLPGLLMTLLASDEKFELHTISFQYVWLIIPPAFLSLIINYKFVITFKSFQQNISAIFIITALIFYVTHGAHPLNLFHKGGYRTISYSPNKDKIQSRTELLKIADYLTDKKDTWIVCSKEVCPQLLNISRRFVSCRTWYFNQLPEVKIFIGSHSHRNCTPQFLTKMGFRKLLVTPDGQFSLWQIQ